MLVLQCVFYCELSFAYSSKSLEDDCSIRAVGMKLLMDVCELLLSTNEVRNMWNSDRAEPNIELFYIDIRRVLTQLDINVPRGFR